MVYRQVLAFYVTRAVLGCVSAAVEAKLCAAVSRSSAFGHRIGWVLLGFLAVAPGMLHAAVAFLPSSSSMVLCTLAFATWIDTEYRASIFCIAASTILVWPFSGALGVPIAVDMLLRNRKVGLFVGTSFVALVVLLGSSVYVDMGFYGRPVVAGLNIVLYNVLSEATSSELYGTEPWTFYFVNGALNLSVAFVLGMLGPAVALGKWAGGGSAAPLLYLSPLAVWIAIFFPQAHKEERFLFPVYPLICLAGASTLVWVTEGVCEAVERAAPSLKRPTQAVRSLVPGGVFTVFCLFSVSRTIATHRGYHAPLDVYREVSRLNVSATGTRICVGKEWYRFTGSFFLPKPHSEGGCATLEFIKSGYDGLLPKPFAAVNGTSMIPTAMNNVNQEEPSRYIPQASCDYIVDRDNGEVAEFEPRFTAASSEWDRVLCRPFLDSGRTPALYRAFYIPMLSESHTVYTEYCLLKRNVAAASPK